MSQTRTDPAPVPGDRRIRARGIARSFGNTKALLPTNLDLGPGGVIGLLGPNGSGKSTLLRLLTGLVPRDAGEAWVDGVPLTGDGTAIRRRATYAPGEIALYTELRAGEHLDWLLRRRDPGARARAFATADALGLPLNHRVRSYSHGMKRQLLLAAALAPDVAVRILDEPTEGLDPSKRGAVLELLAEEARRGTTILLSSHHLGEVDRVCDRLVFLAAGKVLADETAAAVAHRARRHLRLVFEGNISATQIEAQIARARGAQSVRMETAPGGALRAAVLLDDEDPRPFLASAFAPGGVPKPSAIEYGQLSLAELYREIYGVEGC